MNEQGVNFISTIITTYIEYKEQALRTQYKDSRIVPGSRKASVNKKFTI